MNRTLVSIVALSFALAACSDDASSPSASGANVSPVETTPPAPTAPTERGTTPTPVPAPSSTDTPVPPPVGDPGTSDENPGDKDPEPAAFEPSQIPQLALWLRADKGVPSIISKNGIDTWKDSSGNGNDATALPGNNLHLDKVGANNAFAFDGTKAMLIKDSATMRWAGDYTVVIVARSEQKAGAGQLFAKTTNAFPYAGPSLYANFQVGKNANLGSIGGLVDSNNAGSSAETGLDDGATRVLFMERMGDSLMFGINGGAMQESAVATVDTSAVGSNASLGGQVVAGTVLQGFHGDIFEVIAVPTALDAEMLAAINTYAMVRYIK